MEVENLIEHIHNRSVYFVIPFLVCIVTVNVLRVMAKRFDLVDKPTLRKKHKGDIPLVGGVAIFVSFCVAQSLFGLNHGTTLPFLVLACCLVIIGVIDDYAQLGSQIRLVVQALIALGMIYLTGLEINNLGNLVSLGPVYLGPWLGAFFTIFCTIGIVNSINMIDGVDGLAGTLVLISLSALCFLAWYAQILVEALMLLMLCACVSGFLLFNARLIFKRAHVFLGDAGSMLLGFMLLWFFLKLSQSEHQTLSPVGAGWVFGLPLIDTVVVMVKRILNGKSPFLADRTHLHHRLIDQGFSVNKTVATMAAIHGFFVLGGIFVSLQPQSETPMFWLFIVLLPAYYFWSDQFAVAKSNGPSVIEEPTLNSSNSELTESTINTHEADVDQRKSTIETI